MIVNSFDRFDVVNSIGSNKPSFTIWFAGCSHKCKGCHNPLLWDINNGSEYTPKEILEVIKSIDYDYDDVVLLGGEPLEQDDIIELCGLLADEGYKVWLYTGYTAVPKQIVGKLYFAKLGKYEEDLKQEGFPSSSNQRYYYSKYKPNT